MVGDATGAETALGAKSTATFVAGAVNSTTFGAAGAKSVLATYWLVRDKRTKDLITLFYQQLKQKTAKDLALQSAKLELINSSSQSHAHPFYWAAFALTGQVDPLPSRLVNKQPMAGVAIFIVLLLLFLVWVGVSFNAKTLQN